MAIGELYPSVEKRMKSFHELGYLTKGLEEKPALLKPTITLSREFGCEAFPVAEELVRQAEEKTGESWILIDKSLLDAVAKEHGVSDEIMRSLGKDSRLFDDMFATFSGNWKGDVDYYQLLCRQVLVVASAGNAVIVGLGGAIITKALKNCFHYRLIAEHDFKVRSIARRLQITRQEAEIMVLDRQKERDRIIRTLLDANEHEPLLYHAIFNNGRTKNPQLARVILEHALTGKG